MEIHDWLEQNNLDYKEIEENVFEIDGKILVLIAYIEGELVIDKFFELILHEGTPHHVCDYYIFKFGGKYYYCSDTSNPQFNLLKYIGKCKGELNYQYQFPHLGIHGKYELCNGSRSYEDWIVKAKFLNINHIGICEQDTLAGTLAFQSICKKYNINYSLGLTTKTTLGNIKFYVKNDVGLGNLLKINYHLNNDLKTLPIELISELCEGLVVVFGSDFELDQKLVRKIKRGKAPLSDLLAMRIRRGTYFKRRTINGRKFAYQEYEEMKNAGIYF
jgi:hypothetical protein